MQRRLRGAEQAAALDEEPRLEGGRVAELHALQHFASQPGDGHRLLRRCSDESIDVDEGARSQRQLRGAVRQRGCAECPAELREVPAQRAERIVRAREEQLGEMLARGVANAAQDEVGDEPPGLVAARCCHGVAVALEMRPAEQMDGERHRLSGDRIRSSPASGAKSDCRSPHARRPSETRGPAGAAEARSAASARRGAQRARPSGGRDPRSRGRRRGARRHAARRPPRRSASARAQAWAPSRAGRGGAAPPRRPRRPYGW